MMNDKFQEHGDLIKIKFKNRLNSKLNKNIIRFRCCEFCLEHFSNIIRN